MMYENGINMKQNSTPRPFFSIGVPTFNRKELLKQAVASISRQTFTDFEVIVGNSFTQEPLSAELLGFDDPRIRIINHPQDPGMFEGYNVLPRMSRGRYFTWLADDDLFTPDFLQAVYAALINFNYPICVFTSYMTGTTYPNEAEMNLGREARLLTGRQFLKEYLSRSLNVVGCYGVFDSQYLGRNGGMEELNNRISPYSDNLLAIRSGLLENVVYLDAPLVFFRTHEGSCSWTSSDSNAYACSQENLLRKCVGIFSSEELQDDFNSNLFLLLKWCINDFATVVARSEFINIRQSFAYLCFVNEYLSFLKGSTLYWRAIILLMKTTFRLVWSIGKVKISR
jgi:glycosyltransferase involved in cell wall biosynthesis